MAIQIIKSFNWEQSVNLLPAATKLGQGNIFTSVCQEFCPQGGCLPQCMLGYTTPPGPDPHPPPDQAHTPPGSTQHPPGSRHPPDQAHPLDQAHTPQTRHTPLGADTPPGADPQPPGPGTHPPRADPPRSTDTPPWEADCSIRSTSGRYASYWNAFLLNYAKIARIELV